MSNQLPAIQEKTNEAAKLVQKYKNEQALVFVRDEDLKTHPLFLPEVTILKATPNDFHNIQGKFMPKSHFVDRIGEATGVSFIAEKCGTRKEGDWVYVGWAQGKKRFPDGTWRESQVHEYEFDVDTRAKLDFNSKPEKYKTEKAKETHRLELKKFARQRAGTGARLKVIRELVGLPIHFMGDEIQKAMLFSRIAVNTQELLADPEMRKAAIDHALGAANGIYGPPERDVTPSKEALPEPTTDDPKQPDEREPTTADSQPEGPPFDDIPWEDDPTQEPKTELEELRQWFKDRLQDTPQNTRDWISTSILPLEDVGLLKRYKEVLEKKMAAKAGSAS